jgi:hypothetical protein
MSALGHKQTFAVQQAMSALPSKADISRGLLSAPYRPLLVGLHLTQAFDHPPARGLALSFAAITRDPFKGFD